MMRPENWQALIDGLLESVLIVDGIGLRIEAVNAAACALLGYASADMIGHAVIEFAATPEDMFFWEDVAAGMSSEILSETLLLRADGKSVRVDRRVSRIALDTGRIFYIVGIRDQSKQRQTEDELENLLAEMRATLESTGDGILVLGLDGDIRSYNERFAELWEIPFGLITRRDDPAVRGWMARHVQDESVYSARLEALIRSPLLEATDRVMLRSGRVLERVSLPQNARGRPIGRVFSFRDITQRLADEARLQLAAKVFSSSLDAILVIDAELHIVASNPQALKSTGFDESALLGIRIDQLLFKPDDENLLARIQRRLFEGGVWEGEVWQYKIDGSSVPCLANIVQVLDGKNNKPQYIVFFKDLTEKLAANKRIEQLAYSDALTGLPNRVLLGERLEFALGWSRREQKTFAVLFIDLDRFKEINDSLGHDFGDRVLIEVSQRISHCLRKSDTAARLGGDEFLVLLLDVNERGAEVIAEKIINALASPFLCGDVNFTVTCSIGISLYPTDGSTADDLIKNADTAMYRVKERGRAGFRFYQPQMNVDLLSRMKLDHAMRLALVNQEFRLYYQPQINLVSGQVIGVEALLRWRSAELGQVPPDRFIPLAEESGFIIVLGEWVLKEAVRQAALWHASGMNIVVAVNVSALQFQKAGFVASVAEALRQSNLPPRMLELELTESILLQGVDEAIPRLQALADLGVQLSIDDFGTGYSSLTYLKRFPIHKLKIDRSFVKGLPEDESDCAISSSIITLAHALKLAVIAEGVETEAQRAFLLRAHCDSFQGYVVAPALPVEEFESFIQARAGLGIPG